MSFVDIIDAHYKKETAEASAQSRADTESGVLFLLALIAWTMLMILAIVALTAMWYIGWPMLAGIGALLIFSSQAWKKLAPK